MKQIHVKIDKENFSRLRDRKGFLERKNYIPLLEKDAKEGEIGIWTDIRFILEEKE